MGLRKFVRQMAAINMRHAVSVRHGGQGGYRDASVQCSWRLETVAMYVDYPVRKADAKFAVA